MTKLITNDAQLRQYVPQQIVAVKGELTLFDRIAHWLDTAEQWLSDNFTSAPTLTRIASYSEDHPLLSSCRAVVAHEALANAVPSLDLVQTVNGFAVVSNQTLAPASKERVERLIASHRSCRDSAINAMLPLLAEAHAWKSSPQCDFFRASLFLPEHIRPLAGVASWEKYLELRPKILSAESRLAAEFISPELMQRLRDVTLGVAEESGYDKRLAAALRSHVGELVSDKPLRESALRDIVDYIRRHPDDYPEWQSSATARLFAPPIFENKKNAKGYWF